MAAGSRLSCAPLQWKPNVKRPYFKAYIESNLGAADLHAVLAFMHPPFLGLIVENREAAFIRLSSFELGGITLARKFLLFGGLFLLPLLDVIVLLMWHRNRVVVLGIVGEQLGELVRRLGFWLNVLHLAEPRIELLLLGVLILGSEDPVLPEFLVYPFVLLVFLLLLLLVLLFLFL